MKATVLLVDDESEIAGLLVNCSRLCGQYKKAPLR